MIPFAEWVSANNVKNANQITPTNCIRNANGTVIGIRVIEKGGKERITPILNAHKEKTVTKITDSQPAASPFSVNMTAISTTTVLGRNIVPPCWNN